jgi:dihydroorotate dehydrogenase (fumarate)
MNLTTSYLGLTLRHPFVVGASPLGDDLDSVKRLEDAGASAIVLRSLFSEQVLREQNRGFADGQVIRDGHPDPFAFLPRAERFPFGPEEYVAHLAQVKSTVACPVIASLNGASPGDWLGYARVMEEAGADALELNTYELPSGAESSADVEERTLEIVRAVRETVRIPVSVKLSPFYTSLEHFARQLDARDVAGLVLFNRFCQPDIDPSRLQVSDHLVLSSSAELPLRLRWLAILSERLRCSLAASGGVHGAVDGIKAIMAGAHVVQVVSCLLSRGPEYLGRLVKETAAWMEEREYSSIDEIRGLMNLGACPDPSAYERSNYVLMLQTRNR